jgi:hypothetical protein
LIKEMVFASSDWKQSKGLSHSWLLKILKVD